MDIDTTFMAIVGIKKIAISGKALSKWGSTRLRVSLVLDTTGSMADDGKINALKTATKKLITQLQNAVTTDGDVYVSIIPFSKNVNVDSDYYTNSWIDWTDWDSDHRRSSKDIGTSQTTGTRSGRARPARFLLTATASRCTTGPANGASTTGTIPSSGGYAGYICPSVDGGNKNSTKIGIYYNGCYDSVPTTTTATNTVCTGMLLQLRSPQQLLLHGLRI